MLSHTCNVYEYFVVWKHFGGQKTPRVSDMNREICFWFGHLIAVIRIERRGNGLPFTGYVRQVTVKIEFGLDACNPYLWRRFSPENA